MSNGSLFIVLRCCVLGHPSLPNNRWKCGFIWVINYVLPLSTGSACFSSAFSDPWAPLVKDPFLPLSSCYIEKKYSEFVLELCSLSQPGRRQVLKSWLGFPAIPVRLVKDTLTSVYKISHPFLCPITAILMPTSGCDFSLFAIYLITEGLLKGLNTL